VPNAIEELLGVCYAHQKIAENDPSMPAMADSKCRETYVSVPQCPLTDADSPKIRMSEEDGC